MQDKFYVGAKVVCVKNCSSGNFLKGKVYEIIGIAKSKCKCGFIILDLGKTTSRLFSCDICDTHGMSYSGALAAAAEYFRLLETDTELSELSINELLDEILDNDKR